MSTTIITTEFPDVQVKTCSFTPFTDDPEEVEVRRKSAGVPDGAECTMEQVFGGITVCIHYRWWEVTF